VKSGLSGDRERAGISGKVELMGRARIDGRIHELKVISGHPFLGRLPRMR